MSRVRIALVPMAILLVACTSNGGSAAHRPSTVPTSAAPAPTASLPSPTTPHLAAVWSTYHGDNARSGFLRSQPIPVPLRRDWERRLDGAVYAQPIVVGDFVIAATENNTVYALRADSGTVVWQRHLAPPVPRSQLPCGNIDPLGITGTPAYDVETGLVFVVTETAAGRHDLHAIDARDGHPRWTRNLDVVDRDRRAEQQRAALLVAHGKVYVAFGGLFGDCGNYIGYLTSVATSGKGDVAHYAVPSGREAGIWAAPGPLENPRGGVLFAVGNGSETGGSFDGSDSVVRVSPDLERTGYFAPSTWPADNAADLDLGSSSPLLVHDKVVIAGKRGTVYLLGPDLGGIGGQLATLDGCAAYGGGAVVGTAVLLPCADGLRRLDVTGTRMHWTWKVPGVAGSPLVVGDLVYALAADTGDLSVVELRTGVVQETLHIDDVTRFATPAPIDHGLVIGTTTGVVVMRGH